MENGGTPESSEGTGTIDPGGGPTEPGGASIWSGTAEGGGTGRIRLPSPVGSCGPCGPGESPNLSFAHTHDQLLLATIIKTRNAAASRTHPNVPNLSSPVNVSKNEIGCNQEKDGKC